MLSQLGIFSVVLQDPTDPNKHHTGFEAKNVTAIPRIRAALSFMKKDMFEVQVCLYLLLISMTLAILHIIKKFPKFLGSLYRYVPQRIR